MSRAELRGASAADSTAVEERAVVGSSVPRREDLRLLTGRGTFVDDVTLPNMVHAAFLRSPFASARIRRLNVAVARELAGVHAVLTAADLEGVVRPIAFATGIEGHKVPVYTALTGDRARFVGDPVAVVIADDRGCAEDALAAIEVEWEDLPAVVTVDEALAPEAPLVFEELGDNVVYHALHEYGDLDDAFARADRIVSVPVRQGRLTSSALETRGIVVDVDPADGSMTVYASSKAPHMLRQRIAEHLDHDLLRTRAVIRDVGGAFGGKGAIWREDLVVAAASKLLGRPVKWIEDRTENLTAFGGARDQSFEVDAAVTQDGGILALRVRMRLNHGAYPGMWSTPMFAALVRSTMLGQLRVSTFSFETTIVATNKHSYISYRGPGAVETLVRERVLDTIAQELTLDPVDVRRRNLLTVEEQPWKMPMGVTVHRAHARETLEHAVERVEYAALRDWQARARADGRLVGVGIATSIQPCPGFPDWWLAIGYRTEPTPARVRLEHDGSLTVVTSEMPTGQSHETTLAQVAAEALGVPVEQVRVVLGDTDVTPYYFFGTGASRSSNMGAGAVRAAVALLKDQLTGVAATRLGTGHESVVIRDGAARSAEGDELALGELAASVHRAGGAAEREALEALAYYEPGPLDGGWAASTHVCVVDVCPRLGTVAIERYLVVEDCGTLINPAVVDGQIRGGIAQGIGAALYEEAAYDEHGQYHSGSFVTYLVPTAADIPEIEIEHLSIPTDEELAARGIGESGMVMAPAAIANAVADALAPLGARVTELPLTPTRVLELAGTCEPDEPERR